ncbi:ATP-binding cassette domain-containing protein, partial [Arthrobacter sp. Y81]
MRLKKPSTDNAEAEQQPILTVSNLSKVFRVRNAVTKKRLEFKPVDDVSFSMKRGSTLAIVGESGSGKSTTAR